MAESSADAAAAAKRCRHCGTIVRGDHQSRAQHLRDCSGGGTGNSAGASGQHARGAAATPEPSLPPLKPLPVCSFCGKLFRSDAALSEHVCPWTRKHGAQQQQPARPGEELPKGREELQGPVNGRHIQAFRAECQSLKDYDARMKRLLDKRRLLSPAARPTAATPAPAVSGRADSTLSTAAGATTNRSMASSVASASFCGGGDRTVCRRCGKSILTNMQRTHRDSCIVLRLEERLARLAAIAGAGTGSQQPADSGTQNNNNNSSSAHLRSATGGAVSSTFAEDEEIEKTLAALSGVIQLPSGLRRADGSRALSREALLEHLPAVQDRFDQWRESMRAAAMDARSRSSLSLLSESANNNPAGGAARGASPPPLRDVLHRPPVELSPSAAKTADGDTLVRLDSLAATKSADARRTVDFDPDILALAEAVRRGDIALSDATLPNFGLFRTSGYAGAVSPALRGEASRQDAEGAPGG